MANDHDLAFRLIDIARELLGDGMTERQELPARTHVRASDQVEIKSARRARKAVGRASNDPAVKRGYVTPGEHVVIEEIRRRREAGLPCFRTDVWRYLRIGESTLRTHLGRLKPLVCEDDASGLSVDEDALSRLKRASIKEVPPSPPPPEEPLTETGMGE